MQAWQVRATLSTIFPYYYLVRMLEDVCMYVDEQKGSDAIFWRNYKYSCKMHIEAHEVFESILFQVMLTQG